MFIVRLLNYEQVRRYLVDRRQIDKPGKGMKYLGSVFKFVA